MFRAHAFARIELPSRTAAWASGAAGEPSSVRVRLAALSGVAKNPSAVALGGVAPSAFWPPRSSSRVRRRAGLYFSAIYAATPLPAHVW